MSAEQAKLRNLAIILVLLLAGLQVSLWVSSTGVRNVSELKQDVIDQEKENLQLQQKNQTLEAEVNDLKQGLESIEERARSELGMIAKDETFFQLIEDKIQDSSSDEPIKQNSDKDNKPEKP